MIRARLLAGGTLAALLLAGGVYVSQLRDKAQALDAATAALDTERQAHAAYVASIAAGARARELAEKGFLHELDTLRAARARPDPVVRVCLPRAADPSVPAGESATADAGGAAAAAGLVPGGTFKDPERGRDIGPGLAELARAADELSARYRAALAYWGS